MTAEISISTPKSELAVYKENPFLNQLETTIKTKNKITGKVTRRNEWIDTNGEVQEQTTFIAQRKDVDTEEFIKFYAGGLKNVFQLSKTGYELFQILITKYISTNTTKAERADNIALNFSIAKDLFGYKSSERTFQRAIKELIINEFLAPSFYSKDSYWLNPNMFIKGDRVLLVQEYRLKKSKTEQLEERGQLRLGGLE